MSADDGRAGFDFDGRRIPFSPGQSVGAALWAAGIPSWRTTRFGGRPRGLFCGIGVCFDCLVQIDGRPDERACMIPARPGMAVTSRTERGPLEGERDPLKGKAGDG